MNEYDNFNDKDKSIADCFLSGHLSTKSISNKLNISYYQVKYFFDRLFKKYNFASRDQLFQMFFLEKQASNASKIHNILLNIS
jgi:DNA-binding CsgD family transcriptional regulator